MKLNFEVINNNLGTGSYPDLIHFANTQAQIFSMTDGDLYATPTTKIDYGEWADVVMQDSVEASPDSLMTHFELKILQGFGIVGGYKTGNTHKLIIYEFAYEMDAYLNSGSIKHSDNPISTFNLSLENPDLKDPEHPGNVAINEYNSLLSPGAKIVFKFGAGDYLEEYEMGTFYVDRSNFTLLSETASADGRNSIGKKLKDQTVDEKNEFWYGTITEQINKLFDNALIEKDLRQVEPSLDDWGWFTFSPNTDYLKALQTMLELMLSWKIKEKSDGTIVVGSENYNGFDSRGIYTFYRDKDIFSRQITRDDAESYNRVCVHTENYAIAIYKNVEVYTGWNLQQNRTLYVQVANGFTYEDIENHANEIAQRLEQVGKLESFTGPLRPHLQVGDEAIIINKNGYESLGLITEITHNFGKSGYYTNFTVDSGGTVGKGRLSDYISRIALGSMPTKADAGWNDIDMDNYVNLSEYATASATSYWSTMYEAKYAIDGKKYRDELIGQDYYGWMPTLNDNDRFIVIDLRQRCLVDKINLWLGMDLEEMMKPYARIPMSYKIQYFNGSIWVDLLEFIEPDFEETHEFNTIETSKIRFLSNRAFNNETAEYSQPIWREIEIWGSM